MRGKKAIGTAAVFTAFGMFLQGRSVVTVTLTQAAKAFVQKLVSIKRKHSWMMMVTGTAMTGSGPVGDWLAFTVDVMDNFTSVSEPDQFLEKATFVLAASLTSRDMFAGLEPMFDVIRGDGGAQTAGLLTLSVLWHRFTVYDVTSVGSLLPVCG